MKPELNLIGNAALKGNSSRVSRKQGSEGMVRGEDERDAGALIVIRSDFDVGDDIGEIMFLDK